MDWIRFDSIWSDSVWFDSIWFNSIWFDSIRFDFNLTHNIGMDTLNTIEAIGTDNKDKPVEDIKIERVAVFVDPFQEAEDQLKEMREKEIEKVTPIYFVFNPISVMYIFL